ncbi:GCN5 family acetyltransferase [Sulfurifustis variabilis]|uniref:GCN5 family acetyltransferase n=1 Tax=Sulfurifustis variabilis TaxID=1675686 RepID=A0A1B4V9M7_9GAMM|nr:GNAT family N-acetyltransferase [Sulfurifustis variabilis]BAU50279.1 GCN5 family acetyltransferase [Sulfurifustis variabilis]
MKGYRCLTAHDASQWREATEGALAESFDLAWLQSHAPDVHRICLDLHGAARARCSLWWTQTPAYGTERVGLIGHFAALDEPAARYLLADACAQLAGRGCTLAIGPMDGNTWRRYRFVSERRSAPPFFLEPDNPDAWPRYFEAAGFARLAHYSSALTDDLSARDPRIARAADRWTERGIRVRPFEPERFEQELAAIYALSAISFRRNFLYTPIAEAEFIAQYRQVRSCMRPELTLLAETGERLVGFLFALPDVLQAARGEPVDTVIVKTVAVLPDRQCAGLGGWMVGRVQEIAHELGYRRAIHALMHDENRSRNISDRYARPMRGYTLYARRLAP